MIQYIINENYYDMRYKAKYFFFLFINTQYYMNLSVDMTFPICMLIFINVLIPIRSAKNFVSIIIYI